MKRNVFPWAAICLLVLPQLSWAEMQIKGNVHVSVDVTDNGGKSAPGNDPTNIQLVSHKSQIAFSGLEELDTSLNLIWQYAAEFDTDTGSFNGNTDNNDNKIATQDSYIGLAGTIGSFKGGHMATPYRESTDQLDIFEDTTADFNSIFGINPNSVNSHDLRASNMLVYQSPDVYKIRGAIAYIADEDEDGINEPGYSVDLVYNNQSFYMTLAYEDFINQGVGGADDTANKLGLGWDFGEGTKVGVVWEMLDAGGLNNDRDAYQFNISHLTGDITFKFAYTIANDVGGERDTGATNIAVGMFYALSRTTEWYGLYTLTNNDSLVGYGLETVPNGAVGENVSAFSFGLKHEFDNL